MYFRTFSAALLSTLVGTGAWYAYRDPSMSRPFSNSSSPLPPAVTSPTDPTQPRRAVVVENDALFLSPLPPSSSRVSEPLSKTHTDTASGRTVLEMLTPEQVTQKLRTNEESYLVGRGRGVVRYDVVQIPSNNPIEDDHAEKIVEIPSPNGVEGNASSDWMFWGVFDGHSGWTTSAKLRQLLISFVARELSLTYHQRPTSASTSPTPFIPDPSSIDAAIKRGFLALDHEIIHESVTKVLKANSKPMAAELLAPALSGSCALLSFYDSRTQELRVACTGDSRAVLGRRNPQSGNWTATPLSIDQTGGTPSEVDRLRKEHPGEPNVVRNGRILGRLEPSRAFGDSFYKWTRDTQEKIKGSFFGRTPSELLRSPPYVTAEPVVTTTKMEPERGDFVVMATDGLWEMLTNEEVIGLVGRWLEREASSFPSSSSSSSSNSTNSTKNKTTSWLTSWYRTQRTLPVDSPPSLDSSSSSGQRLPIRQEQWWGGSPSSSSDTYTTRFVVEDKNAATHLVRNALGEGDRDMLSALLTLVSPGARRYRDDLTVSVIFFGEPGTKSVINSENTKDRGEVLVNREASASYAASSTNGERSTEGGAIRAKL
ncbi:MAG: hypothetical protein M1817_003954 [Caeruleum heppii]|nr:MAG: hypothetical protein M1817_003954 [Caeruleum heppii]